MIPGPDYGAMADKPSPSSTPGSELLATPTTSTWSFNNLHDTIVATARRPPIFPEPAQEPKSAEQLLTPSLVPTPTPTPIITPAPTLKPVLTDGEVANISLPIQLPVHLKRLLRSYFTVNHTDQVPFEIYHAQVDRIFRTLNRTNGIVKFIKAVFVSNATHGRLTIDVYRLKSMRRGKCSERLLVASGENLVEPVILARTKPYSREFRAWKGAIDNGTGPVIATRIVLDEEVQNTKDKGFRKVSYGTAEEGDVEEETARVDVMEDNREGDKAAAGTKHKLGKRLYPPAAAKRQRLSVTPILSPMQQSKLHRVYQHDTAQSPIQPSNSTVAPPAQILPEHDIQSVYVPDNITIYFLDDQGDEVRPSRNWKDCNTLEKIFGNALVGGLLPTRAFGVVMATVVRTGEKLPLVDDRDFRELTTMVENDSMQGERDVVVEIRRFG